MRLDILTLFPDMVGGGLRHSLVGKALERGDCDFCVHDLRDYAEGRHRVCDDYPFGGGEGMVMKVEPISRALAALPTLPERRVLLMSPGGTRFDQAMARRLVQLDQVVLICGHYEGVDERVRAHLVDEEVSIGDFVLTGGELPALVICEAIIRLMPGVVGSEASLLNECFEQGLLDFPQYTRPREFQGWTVPDILLSGDHARIAKYRREEALRRTWRARPELLEQVPLTDSDRRFLRTLGWRPDPAQAKTSPLKAKRSAGGVAQDKNGSQPEQLPDASTPTDEKGTDP